MEEIGYAKINLALHVRGRRADGYHDIETLFAFAEQGDVLRVEEGEGLSLRLEGPFSQDLSDGDDNLVLRAARLLRQHKDVAAGAGLALDKRLPVASGIGGGSADAAAALRLLNRFWNLGLAEQALAELGRGLGADVAACIESRTSIGRGKGDELSPVDAAVQPGTPLLLVNPGVALSTADVFNRWSGEDGGFLPSDWHDGRNDLEAPAKALAPAIAQLLGALRRREGARIARMSGSGATCFALFESEADRDSAEAWFAARFPGWWRLSTRIR